MNYVIMIIGTLLAAIASFCLKKSSNSPNLLAILRNYYFDIGGFLYIISCMGTIWLLQRMSYSAVVPIGSICYIWTMLISYKFLGESINKYKITGLALIITGVIFVTR
jgi:drug/metabolite transporter (DMT)-like permease